MSTGASAAIEPLPLMDRLAGSGHACAQGAKMLEVADDPEQLRRTFDSAADEYQDARPEYPEQLFETLVEVAGLRPGDRLLEVGCATGKATLPLARCGFRITCVEIVRHSPRSRGPISLTSPTWT